MENTKKIFFFAVTAVLLLILAAGQNCDGTNKDVLGSKLTKINSGKFGSRPSPTPTPTPPPPPPPPPVDTTDLGGIIDPNCKTNSNYNACIFKKNPVAQNGGPISGGVAPGANLDPYLQFAVNISGLDSSGSLQNSFIRVLPGGSKQRARATGGIWKFSSVSDTDRKVGQVMAYYWLNYQKEYCQKEAKGFYVNQLVPVTTAKDGLENAYWDGSQIVMGITSRSEYALGAEIYLHEMGHGNLDFAFSKAGSNLDYPSSTHVGCGRGVCCKTADGCIAGINEGQADYHAAMIYSQKPAMGEAIVNNTSGFSECGVTRDPARNRNFSISQAYNACSSLKGEVHLVGRPFASIFYEVRKSAGANGKEVDQIFMAFLPTMQSTDTYKTILNKIKTTDQQMFQGKYSTAFTTEFAAHGIQ